jgi:dTMP kinase
MIIALEGPDGCGKTRVSEEFEALVPHGTVRLRDPGSTRLGEVLRPVLLDKDEPLTPEELALLFAATSSALVRKAAAMIKAGARLVVLDRCFLSNYPYRMADSITAEDLDWLYQFVNGCVPPEHLFVLQVPEEVRRSRLKQRPGSGVDRFESKEKEWQARRDAFYDWCLLHHMATEIDGNRPPREVARDILDRIKWSS